MQSIDVWRTWDIVGGLNSQSLYKVIFNLHLAVFILEAVWVSYANDLKV